MTIRIGETARRKSCERRRSGHFVDRRSDRRLSSVNTSGSRSDVGMLPRRPSRASNRCVVPSLLLDATATISSTSSLAGRRLSDRRRDPSARNPGRCSRDATLKAPQLTPQQLPRLFRRRRTDRECSSAHRPPALTTVDSAGPGNTDGWGGGTGTANGCSSARRSAPSRYTPVSPVPSRPYRRGSAELFPAAIAEVRRR